MQNNQGLIANNEVFSQPNTNTVCAVVTAVVVLLFYVALFSQFSRDFLHSFTMFQPVKKSWTNN